jgi:hypothetical protein
MGSWQVHAWCAPVFRIGGRRALDAARMRCEVGVIQQRHHGRLSEACHRVTKVRVGVEVPAPGVGRGADRPPVCGTAVRPCARVCHGMFDGRPWHLGGGSNIFAGIAVVGAYHFPTRREQLVAARWFGERRAPSERDLFQASFHCAQCETESRAP